MLTSFMKLDEWMSNWYRAGYFFLLVFYDLFWFLLKTIENERFVIGVSGVRYNF